MEHNDFQSLLEIVADLAMSPIGVKEFFRDLIKRTNLPKKWQWEVFDIWTGNPGVDAEKLIKWATDSKNDINPEDSRFKTLGSILHPLLPSLGIDQARLMIKLIIRYGWFLDNKVLIDFLIDNQKYQAIFDENDISILTEYVSHIIEDDTNKIASELIQELIQIFLKINEFELTPELFLATFDNLQLEQISNNSSSEIDILKQKDHKLFKVFVLFYLLLEKHSYSKQRLQRVIDFSTFLQQQPLDISDSLKEWLSKVKQKYGYQSSKLRKKFVEAQTNSFLDAYLMVIIREVKPLSRRKFRVNGFLKIDKDFAEWIYPHDQSSNVLTMRQAENYVAKLIYKSIELVLSKKTQLKYKDYSLTIEFFLPSGYLCEDVDQWKMDLETKIPIGRDYNVAVRSYERIASEIGEGNEVPQSPIFLGRLERRWQDIPKIIEDNSLTDDLKLKKEKFECFVQGDSYNLLDLEGNLLHKKIGLKFTFAPPKSKKKRKDLFGVFLRTGTPIAIWLRENQIQGVNLETETDKWIKHKYLADLNLLLADIKTERENAYFKKSILGNYLVIFCDNPTRRPTKPLPLSTSQPLSAPK